MPNESSVLKQAQTFDGFALEMESMDGRREKGELNENERLLANQKSGGSSNLLTGFQKESVSSQSSWRVPSRCDQFALV
jgi:hypothetical protein